MDNNKSVVIYRWLLIMLSVITVSGCAAIGGKPAMLDRDQDNVADANDACLSTLPGNPVGPDGCAVFRGKIDAVDFGPGDHRLNAASRESLAQLVDLLNTHPEVVLQLGGHTDNRGAATDNLALSKRRVMSVVKYLVANGVEGNRLKPFGFGESRPIISNTTAEGRAKNRRIEMSVVTQ